MSYEKIRNKTVPKYLFGGSTYNFDLSRTSNPTNPDYWMLQGFLPKQALLYAQLASQGNPSYMNGTTQSKSTPVMPGDDEIDAYEAEKEAAELAKLQQETPGKLDNAIESANVSEPERIAAELRANSQQVFKPKEYDKQQQGLSEKAQIGIDIASQAVLKAVNVADEATMGDKNFSASSLAIDTAVHGVSGALMKSGNPFAIAAGAALEGINFITKAGGRTVPGFDVDINNSGYGNLGHMESESGRIWDNMDRKLAKRNEQARMALAAQNVSQEQEYEQEARSNSVTNVLLANQIALAGGIDTSLLGN